MNAPFTPTTRDIAAELAPIVGMHVAQRAALRIVKHRANAEQAQVEWDRYEAEAASDPYFGGQGPRW
jgi:hypothetical protein